MQAIPTSIVSPSNAPNPAIALVQAVSSQPADSLFGAIFQDALRGAGNAAKFPPAGKPQDSAREPSNRPGTTFSGPLPPPVSVPLTFAPILNGQQHAAANAPATMATAAQASAAGEQSLGPSPATLPTPLPIPAPAPLPVFVSQASFPETGLKPPRNFVPSGPPANASATARLFDGPSTGSGNSPSAVSLARSPNDFAAVDENIFPAQEQPTSADATAQELSDPAAAASRVPQDAEGQLAWTAPALDFNQGPNPAPQGSDAPKPEPQATVNPPSNVEAANSVFSALQVDLPAVSSNDSVLSGLKGAGPAVPAKQALENLAAVFPAFTIERISVASPQHLAARQQIQLPQLPLQPQANATTSPDKISSTSTEGLPPAATSPSATSTSSLFKLHENPQPPAGSPAPVAPAVSLPVKGPGQDHSNESAGNKSNLAPDHTSPPSGEKNDEKNFVQTLDAAATSSSNPHPAQVDPAPAASASPVQAQVATPEPQRVVTSSAEPTSTSPALPNAHGAPVVNSAHIVDQPGQTEIRIEMQADSLGGVELRAHIAGDQIGASIAVEHHEAQLALATELPALHSALAEKNLRVETLSITQGTFSSLSGGHGQDPGQRGQAHYPAKLACAEQPEPHPAFNEIPGESLSAGKPANRLSVVA